MVQNLINCASCGDELRSNSLILCGYSICDECHQYLQADGDIIYFRDFNSRCYGYNYVIIIQIPLRSGYGIYYSNTIPNIVDNLQWYEPLINDRTITVV